MRPIRLAAVAVLVAQLLVVVPGVNQAALATPKSQSVALVPNAQGRTFLGGTLPTSGFPNGYAPTYSNITPESIRDNASNPIGTGFDTVVLVGICDIGSFLANAQFKSRIEGFVSTGGKLIIWDSECQNTDYSSFVYPFTTNNPGQAGAQGTLTDFEENTLSSVSPTSSSYVNLSAVSTGTDAVGDANVFVTPSSRWFADLQATNINGVNGPAQAYANLGQGLIIYSGLDKDNMNGAAGFDLTSTSGWCTSTGSGCWSCSSAGTPTASLTPEPWSEAPSGGRCA